jgi:hypothetical protein
MQVVDQMTQPPGLLQKRRQVVVVTRMDPVHLSLDLTLQHGQRVPQLVGDVGQEAPPLLLVGGQPGRHLVEGLGEEAQLAGPSDLHVDPVVPRGHLLGRVE